MLGHFRRAGVVPKRIVREFAVTADAHVPIGTTLSAVHFVPGQYVDVIANSYVTFVVNHSSAITDHIAYSLTELERVTKVQ